MSYADERGALGKRFHDLPTTPDSPDLAWEAMARHVLSPEPPEEEPDDRVPVLWWWLAGAVVLLLIALSVWFARGNTAEEVVAVPQVIAKTSSADLVPKVVEPTKSLVPGPERETAGNQVFGPVNALHRSPSLQKGITESPTATFLSEKRETRSTTPVTEFLATVIPGSTDTQMESELVDGLPPLNFELFTVEASLPSPMVVRKDEPKDSGSSAMLSLQFGGVSFASRYSEGATWLQDENNELSPELSLRYYRPVGKRFFISSGLELRNYRFRTAFESVDTEARIYQPGTVDTIFRNLTSGEERIVTTDTVGGTRTLRFGNDNTVMELGLPLLIGRKWTSGRHDFRLAAGPRLGLVLARTGKTVTETNRIADLEAAPQFSKGLNWAGRLEVGYGFRLTPLISLLGNVGIESSLSDWAETAELKQRPTVLNGRLGLRYTLK